MIRFICAHRLSPNSASVIVFPVPSAPNIGITNDGGELIFMSNSKQWTSNWNKFHGKLVKRDQFDISYSKQISYTSILVAPEHFAVTASSHRVTHISNIFLMMIPSQPENRAIL